MRFLLDTDTCIAAMKGRDVAVAKLSTLAPIDCAISTVTVFELQVGVAKCREPDREAAKVKRFLETLTVLPLDVASARKAGEVRADLERQGIGIGPYDVLLAGQALTRGLAFVTNNVGEFQRVAGLKIERW
jgi:tRNA(fMet)-specific endonuclease VapC